jgi:hypothetical protein
MSVANVPAGLTVTDHHRDILISSYLHGTKPNPRAAIEILTASENMGRPFPQSSYNVILTHLVEPTLRTQTDSHSRALAWDLFANMRLSAHSTPTRELYTTMIRACGQSTDPQPERARDLWIELTTGSGRVKPNRQEYDSIIRALGSTKDDYLEAFDLLRQMLALHQEATFVPFEKVDMTERMSPWVPTVETFTALLEGTKRAADLDRARWVLSEVVDLARAAAFSGQNLKGPDADLMTNVFMTYAAWTPPISRSSVTVQKEAGAEEDAAPESDEGPTEVVESDHDSSNDMPRTAAEALREADMLFQRIITDANAEARGPAAAVHHPFAGVKLTPRLVNSYLSVHLAHAPTYADARRVHEKVWEGLAKLNNGPRPNGWTFLDIMGRCTRGSISLVDRPVASVWGAATWDAYRKWADKALKEMDDDLRQRRHRFVIGLSERQIERMWGYGIRHAALNGDIDLALKRLGEFVQLYPPSDLLKTYQPAPRQEGFKITMMDPTTVAEPNVPPHLLFRDLNMVHQACLRDENMRGVHMIKFATTAYLKALQRRRNWRLNNAGVARVLQKKKKGVFVKSGVLENNRVAAPEEDEDE